MGVFLIAIHLIIVVIMYVLMEMKILKVDRLMFVMVVFIPVWGALASLIITYMENAGKVGAKNEELEMMRGNLTEGSGSAAPVQESQNIVPLEDALIMDDPTVRRSVIMDVLMSDAKSYINVLDQARMNDDVEVVHYATTAMVELSKEYELKLQEYSSEYAENPTKEGLIDEYINFLEQYIASNMIQGQLLEIQRSTLQQLLTSKVVLNPNMDDYSRLVKSYLDSKQLIKAEVALGTMEENWPEDERNFLLRLRYYFETGEGGKISEMVEKVKNSDKYYSREIRDLVHLWEKAERKAGA